MNPKTKNLLLGLKILAWLAALGLAFIAGSIIVSYLVSIWHVQASHNLYKGLDLSAYRNRSFIQYTLIVLYKAGTYSMQAYVAYLVATLLDQVNLLRPFSSQVVRLLEKISAAILGVWLLAVIYNIHVAVLQKVYGIVPSFIEGDFLFLAGIVFVLAQVFKRGVAIQSENELTV